ncbi:MAG: DUF6677 family protein [Gemmataceae bacterium]
MRKLDLAAAFLSYLVPGLGQLAQGRIGKAGLFFVGVYGLFFYGMALGQGRNVYFGDTASPRQLTTKLDLIVIKGEMPRVVVNLFNRPQFAGQFWVGIAAWPAIWHYHNDAPVESFEHKRVMDELDKQPLWKQYEIAVPEDQINKMQRDGDKRWDLGWVYTVIAGVLNVLVIYDALAGPAFVHGVPDGKGGRPA